MGEVEGENPKLCWKGPADVIGLSPSISVSRGKGIPVWALLFDCWVIVTVLVVFSSEYSLRSLSASRLLAAAPVVMARTEGEKLAGLLRFYHDVLAATPTATTSAEQQAEMETVQGRT